MLTWRSSGGRSCTGSGDIGGWGELGKDGVDPDWEGGLFTSSLDIFWMCTGWLLLDVDASGITWDDMISDNTYTKSSFNWKKKYRAIIKSEIIQTPCNNLFYIDLWLLS